MEKLFYYLMGLKAAEKAQGTGFAEYTARGATRLGGDAGGFPALTVNEEHRLNHRPVGQVYLKFYRPVGVLQPVSNTAAVEAVPGGKLIPQFPGKIGHIVEGEGAPGYPLEYLGGPERRLPSQYFC
jgi:hypothetical protein